MSAVLLNNKIKEEIENGNIEVVPFNPNHVGPNSVDVTLSNKIVTYFPLKFVETGMGLAAVKDVEAMKRMEAYSPIIDDVILFTSKPNQTFEYEILEEGLILVPGIMYLGSTNERAGSDRYIPMYEGRSSKARLSFQSHISAGFGDIGFKSNWTLEILVTNSLHIFPNERVGQVYFIDVSEEEFLKMKESNGFYKGKYTDQPGPQVSKSYEDFK